MSSPEWLATSHDDDGRPRFRVGRLGEDLVAEWVGSARLIARRDGRAHELTFEADLSEPERRKLRRGPARVLLRHLEGGLGFHGSAADLGGRAVVFLGASGRGKSTMAAALCAAVAEATLLADDAVALDLAGPPFAVIPTESEHWIDRDARAFLGRVLASDEVESDKIPISAKTPAAPIPLAALVTLEWSDGDAVRSVPLEGVQALAALLPHVVRFVLDSPDLQRRELERLEALARSVPVYRLERPQRFERLPAAVDFAADLCKKPRVEP